MALFFLLDVALLTSYTDDKINFDRVWILQAAKEFESELKKDPEALTEQSEENPTAVSAEKKPGVEVTSSKESVWVF